MANPSIRWYRWPAKPRNGLLPWYRILWNLIWLVPIVVVGTLLIFLAFCKEGPEEALRLRQDIF